METDENEPASQFVNLAAAKAALIKTRTSEESKKMDAGTIQNLHPRLKPHIDWERRVIEHPLLRTDLYYPATLAEIDRINSRFERALAAWQEAMQQRRYATCLHLTERPWRLDTFVDEIEPLVNDQQYWELLAEIWIDTEYPYVAFNTWQQLFAAQRPGRVSLMNKKEQATLSALPDTLALYRGGRTKKGLSWTLSEEQARRFAIRFGDDVKRRVFKGTVPKDKVYAYLNERKEQEIVVDPRHVTIE